MDVAINPAYEMSFHSIDRSLPTGENIYELDNSVAVKNDREVTRAAQEKPKNTKSCKASLLIGIALFIAILALLLAAVSVGLTMAFYFNTEMKSLAKQLSNGQSTALTSTADLEIFAKQLATTVSDGLSIALNSTSEIQSLTVTVNKLQLSLSQSVNTIEDLGHQISAVGLQTNETIQYVNEALRQRVSQLERLINETLDVQLKAINDSLKDTKLQVSDKATETMMKLEQVSQNQRAVYTRWGSSSCPNINGTTLVYNGVVGGTPYTTRGGGSNHLCMPLDPEYTLPYQPGVQGFSYVYPSEYETAYLGDQNENVPCAVCSVSTRTQALMIPAKTSCPTDWTREYYGYLVAEQAGAHRSSFICVDMSHERVPNTSGHRDGTDLWQTEAHCSLYACPPYNAEKELVCVVCSK